MRAIRNIRTRCTDDATDRSLAPGAHLPGRKLVTGRRLGRSAGVAVAAAAALLAAACTGSSPTQIKPAANAKAAAKAKARTATGPDVTITPANDARNADPSAGITVTAAKGTLKNVVVHTSGGAVSGSLTQGGTVWHSQWALNVSQTYTVTATASGRGGTTTTKTSTFRTLTPSQTFRTMIIEGASETYGVGIPILLEFSQRITDKAAVERALQVTTSKPVVGAWYWDDQCGLSPTCAYFRPRDYWPVGTTVSFTGHLNGVRGAPGMYGYHTLTQTFSIGPSLIAIGNTFTHRTQIYYDGRLRYDWPISSGRPGDDTPNGSYLTIEKENPVEMKGPGYDLLVPYSVRFTWSGDYYHDAYWSVGEQGFQNVSHGCVNLSPADAQTYYNLAVPGDPITIKGSPKGGTWDNGWTMWFLSWPQYLKGSALHEAVEAGPNGSTFVSPASLPPSTARAPLQTAPNNNSAAS
ncbi:MAG: L,D-transpeptidase family protein [Streptosporangiaceae bacterium]|nr:L,D-transpeptidase family protein [Streptosporangiaceae bacterium]MBV9854254.1 L,D-transpeptidase family protein [Streptosporangiaceae bacterium]